MKRMIALMIALFLLQGCACAEYWQGNEARSMVCCDNRPGCQVLQAVMMGSFARFDPEDSLNVRVFSAALPRLTAVSREDFAHFTEAFDLQTDRLREVYFIALGNCLRSDILVNPLADDMDEQNARTVLYLFLNPDSEDAQAQMQAIRENCTDEVMQMLAENAQVPVEFVEYLVKTPQTGPAQ